MEDSRAGPPPTTLSTSRLSTSTLLNTIADAAQERIQALMATQETPSYSFSQDTVRTLHTTDSTTNGVVIGLLSSFGSAVLIAVVFLVVYFFRYTSSGRILLDRIGRPGEYDDEQAYAREEAEAMEEMDDLQRTEYLRAKGMHTPRA